jgi:hypothetical protein
MVSFTPQPHYTGERAPGILLIGGCVDHSTSLDALTGMLFLLNKALTRDI